MNRRNIKGKIQKEELEEVVLIATLGKKEEAIQIHLDQAQLLRV